HLKASLAASASREARRIVVVNHSFLADCMSDKPMSAPVTCPHCETALYVSDSAFVTCPSCRERLPTPYAASNDSGVDAPLAWMAVDVERLNQPRGCLFILASWGLVTIILGGFIAGLCLIGDNFPVFLAITGVFGWCALLGTCIAFWRSRDNPELWG